MREPPGKQVLYLMLLLLSLVPAFVTPHAEAGAFGSLLVLGLVLYYIRCDRDREAKRPRGFPVVMEEESEVVDDKNRRTIEALEALETGW